MPKSLDERTVDGFGFEWTTYDQSARDPESLSTAFARYTSIFPWDRIPTGAVGVDLGCGSGRWSRLFEERGPHVVALDASLEAIEVARIQAPDCSHLVASARELPLARGSLDYAFSLGVLHHMPDTEGALVEIHRVLRPGAPFLVYLYYAFDNRPTWFRAIWKASDAARRAISRAPHRARLAVTRLIAATVYLPLARGSRLLARLGLPVGSLPLSAYRDQPFYVMQTDALDRFGTRLEQRYTRAQIQTMLEAAGFRDIRFREDWPYWCAIGTA